MLLSPLTETDAADPAAYAVRVEQVVGEAMLPDTQLKGSRAKAMIDALGTACEVLTGYTLEQATAKRSDPLENLRDVMARAKVLIKGIEAQYRNIDTLRPVAAQRCDYTPPDYPATEDPAPIAEAPEATQRHRDARAKFGQVLDAVNNMLAGTVAGLHTKQLLALIGEACKATLGEDLATVAREAADPVRRATDLIAMPEEEIRSLATAYRHLDGATPQEIAAWDALCERVIALQTGARRDPARFAAYAGRDADAIHAGELLDMQWFHVAAHDIWSLKDFQNTLTCMPNGAGKSTQFRLRRAWRTGKRPEIRRLVLLSDQPKAEEEVGFTLRLMTDPRGYFRAIFPHIRVLGRVDGAKKTCRSFTVARKNQAYARDATISGFGATCNIEGKGFDEIDVDDPQAVEARYQQYRRDAVTQKMEGPIPSRLRVAADRRMDCICTPLHPDDWVGRLRRAAAAGEKPSWKITIRPFAHRLDAVTGEYVSLWTKVITPAQLREMSRGAFFKCSQLLEDTVEERRVVSGVRYYPCDPDDPHWAHTTDAYKAKCLDRLRLIRNGEQWLSIDPSGTRGKHSAQTAVGRYSLVPGQKEGSSLLYLLRVDYRPGDPVALREWLVEQVVGSELFAERYIRPDDDEAVKVEKRTRWQSAKPARGNVSQVLIEGSGAQASGTNLIVNDVPELVREMGIEWGGTVRSARVVAIGGKSNIGKRARLTESAGLLHGGYVKFPGRWTVKRGDETKVVLTSVEDGGLAGDARTLIDQTVNFDDRRTNDGVDQLTQILLDLHQRLTRELPDVPNSHVATDGGDPFQEALRESIRQAFETPDADPESEEIQWIKAACA